MDPKMIIWIYLPILTGGAITILAVWNLLKRQSANSTFLFIMLAFWNGLAVYGLIFMLTRQAAFPSLTSYPIIAISFIILLIRAVIKLIAQKKA